MGHRDRLFEEPRRPLPGRLLRPHGLHRNVALDRSRLRDVRRLPLQPRSSRWEGGRPAAASPRLDDRGRRGHGRLAPAGPGTRGPSSEALARGLRGDRRARGRRLPSRRRQAHRPRHQRDRPRAGRALDGRGADIPGGEEGGRHGRAPLLSRARPADRRRRSRRERHGSRHGAARRLAVRGEPPPEAGGSRRARRDRARHPGRRRALLHLHHDGRVPGRGGREGEDPARRPRPARPDRRRRRRGTARRFRQALVHRVRRGSRFGTA